MACLCAWRRRQQVWYYKMLVQSQRLTVGQQFQRVADYAILLGWSVALPSTSTTQLFRNRLFASKRDASFPSRQHNTQVAQDSETPVSSLTGFRIERFTTAHGAKQTLVER